MDKLRPVSSAENTTVWTRCGFYSLKGQIELETGMSCRCRHAKIKYFRNTTQRRFPLGVGEKKSTVVPAQQRTLKHVVKLPYNSERAKGITR